MARVVVTGAGGFIGGHLVKRLLDEGHTVTAVDRKPFIEWHQKFSPTEYDVSNHQKDLRYRENCVWTCAGADIVYNLAADMGGMGFIETHKTDCMLSVLISTHMLQAAQQQGVKSFFYSSSACVYAADKQTDPNVTALKEADAYPAEAEDGYGWEKLFSERLGRHYMEDTGLRFRTARYHNVYGPCFDKDTEVLTWNGWKYFEGLTDDDAVASLNPETNEVEYLVPVARQAYPYKGDMYRVENRSVDQLVTPDHKLFVKTRSQDWSLQEAKSLKWDMARMTFTSYGVWFQEDTEGVPDVSLPEVHGSDGRELHAERYVDAADWYEFVGWYVSEGSSWSTERNYTVNISQNPGPKQDAIVGVIRRLGFTCHVNGKNVVVSNKQLWKAVQQFGHGAKNKRLGRDILKPWVSREIQARLFNALMAGDGDSDGGRYSTASYRLADDFQELALRFGYRVTKCADGDMWRVHLSKRQITETRRSARSIEQYDGYVYDVTLPKNHILMVRRNGKVSWSGNCGTWHGGREKAPAAICRKVIEGMWGDKMIEIWGDGEQTRSFMFVDDCVEGTRRIMDSEITYPINLGSSELVSINQLVTLVEDIAGVKLNRRYKLDAPQGVRGRNSDNTLIKQELDWEPSVSLREGLEKTYEWIYNEMLDD